MKLTSIEARRRVKPSSTFYQSIYPGLSLGYRRNKKGGVWIARIKTAEIDKTEVTLAHADDEIVANGDDVLNFKQAVAAAVAFHESLKTKTESSLQTVADVMEYYFQWYQRNRKSARRTRYIIDRHIIPRLGYINVVDLTTAQIRNFLHEVAAAPKINRGKIVVDNSPDSDRKRKSTANRVLTYLKAALNHAYRDGLISNDAIWKRVKPYRGVEKPKIRHLNDAQVEALLDNVSGDFGDLVKAALYTGGRYGELTALRVKDFDGSGVTFTKTKSGKPRHVPLSDSGAAFFVELCSNNSADSFMLTLDGKQWKHAQQCRRFKNACRDAGIGDFSFHDLRHTYASRLAMNDVPLWTIAQLLGHSDTRITSKHYAHLSPSYLADTVKTALPNF